MDIFTDQCHRCDDPAHRGKVCEVFTDGRPYFTSSQCKCAESVTLDDIDLALHKIKQHLPKWEQGYLEVLADAIGRPIPNLPSRTDARAGK